MKTGSPFKEISKGLRKTEISLYESDERFRKIFEDGPIGMAIVGPDFHFIKANASFCKMTGYTEAELINHTFSDITHPEHVSTDIENVKKVLTGEIPLYRTQKRYIRKDGTILWCDLTANAIRDNRGAFLYFLSVIEDITERKRAEEAILRAKLLLQSMIDSTPDWMYVKDLEHRFLLVNRSFAEAQHLHPQDMIGRPDTDFFPEGLCLGNPDEGIRGYHDDDLQTFQGQMVHNPRNLVTWADGSLHMYDTYKMPLTDQCGKIYAALVYSRDITERQKAEEQREAALKALQRTLHDVIDTLSRVVELRDPYTAGHQRRVADLAGAIAREMKMDDSRIEHLIMAAKIHDIGKIYVPSDILSKPGKLSDMEFNLIKTHTQGSYNILRDIEFSQPIALMTLQHHERLDGSGYPNGLKGGEMLTESKILAVADVVEAICSNRPYRPALGIDKALDEISKNKGKLYDPDAVDACLKLFTEKRFKFEE